VGEVVLESSLVVIDPGFLSSCQGYQFKAVG